MRQIGYVLIVRKERGLWDFKLIHLFHFPRIVQWFASDFAWLTLLKLQYCMMMMMCFCFGVALVYGVHGFPPHKNAPSWSAVKVPCFITNLMSCVKVFRFPCRGLFVFWYHWSCRHVVWHTGCQYCREIFTSTVNSVSTVWLSNFVMNCFRFM